MNFIFVIQKEILRLDCSVENKTMKIWCGNGEDKGFSDDYQIAKIRCNKLNAKNKSPYIRYVIQEVERIRR